MFKHLSIKFQMQGRDISRDLKQTNYQFKEHLINLFTNNKNPESIIMRTPFPQLNLLKHSQEYR